MPTAEKPLISILMAVYNPRLDWLKLQLDSLNAQSYPNLRLYIRDDCSPNVAFSSIESLVKTCITAFPFTLTRNEKNLGSNLTFELLTQEAEGEYFSYCDQDDIWLPEKLSVLQQTIEKENATLVCSDMIIIDGTGKQIADSITKIRRHHVFHSGTGLAPSLLVSNFATGCTVLIRADIARSSVPFCPYMVHDHYLNLVAAQRGKIISLPDTLIYYRIHSSNQTPIMAGVTDKNSYLHNRIDLLISRLQWLQDRFSDDSALADDISERLVWANARKNLFIGNKEYGKTVWEYRRFGPSVSLFEIAASYMPEAIFSGFIRMAQKNII